MFSLTIWNWLGTEMPLPSSKMDDDRGVQDAVGVESLPEHSFGGRGVSDRCPGDLIPVMRKLALMF